MSVTRRFLLRGPIAAAAAPVAAANPGPSAIETLFVEWEALRNAPSDDEDGGKANYRAYRALQERIVGLEPVTARDVAIQFFVDSDAGESVHSRTFAATIERLTGAKLQPETAQDGWTPPEAKPELPVERVVRLAKEIAIELDEVNAAAYRDNYDDDELTHVGMFVAKIYPWSVNQHLHLEQADISVRLVKYAQQMRRRT